MVHKAVLGIAVALLAPGVRNVSSTPFLTWACRYAAHRGFRITATTNGRHNHGSKHYRGLAIDVSVRGKNSQQLAAFRHGLDAWGWRLRDERQRPAHQAVWHGGHWHIEARGDTWQRRTPSPSAGLRRAFRPTPRVGRALSPSAHRPRMTRPV